MDGMSEILLYICFLCINNNGDKFLQPLLPPKAVSHTYIYHFSWSCEGERTCVLVTQLSLL